MYLHLIKATEYGLFESMMIEYEELVVKTEWLWPIYKLPGGSDCLKRGVEEWNLTWVGVYGRFYFRFIYEGLQVLWMDSAVDSPGA